MKSPQRIFAALFLILLIPTFQNCEGFKPISGGATGSLSEDNIRFEAFDLSNDSIKNSLQPNLLDDCFSNSDYNACIFWKNPVAQLGSALSQPVTSNSNLSDIQLHAVNISGYDNSGFLRNSSMRIFAHNDSTGKFEALSTSSGRFKFPYENDPAHRFSQVMAYHWLNTQENLMNVRTGRFFASNKSIDVLSYTPNIANAFWDPTENEIIIGTTSEGNEFSLSAEVYAHEMGHANASYATNQRIFESVGSFKSITCNDTVCCKDSDGCSWAIDEGQADYHYAILFPQDTDMLETFTNTSSGLKECGLSRSLEQNKTLTSLNAYNACSGGYAGEVHVMGRVYASVWWEIRKKAMSMRSDGDQEVDTLFTNHLPALEGRDDFLTALDKIVATDLALYGGRYGNLFIQEFARRGVFQ